MKRDTCCIHDEKLFNFLSMWINSKSRNPGCWNYFLPYLTFGCMSVDFIIENVIYKDIISDDYALKLISYLTSLQVKSNILLNNTCSSRQCISTKDVEVNRFFERSPNNTWTCDPLNGDRISFSVSDNVKLHGVTLFVNPNTSFLVEVSLYSVNDLIVKVKNRVEVSDNCEFPLSFPKRVQLQRDMVYTVCVTISGDDIYFGMGGFKTVRTVVGLRKRVKVSFLDSLCSETTDQREQKRPYTCVMTHEFGF